MFSVVKAGADARRSSMEAYRRLHETRLRLDLAVATGVLAHFAQQMGEGREAAELVAADAIKCAGREAWDATLDHEDEFD